MRELGNRDLAITIIEDFEPSWLDTGTSGALGLGSGHPSFHSHTFLLRTVTNFAHA